MKQLLFFLAIGGVIAGILLWNLYHADVSSGNIAPWTYPTFTSKATHDAKRALSQGAAATTNVVDKGISALAGRGASLVEGAQSAIANFLQTSAQSIESNPPAEVVVLQNQLEAAKKAIADEQQKYDALKKSLCK